MDLSSRAVFADGMLIASTKAGMFAWRLGAIDPAWKNSLVAMTQPAGPTSIVLWRGSLWALVGTHETGHRLVSVDPVSGRVTNAALDVSHVSAVDGVGGRLIVIGNGGIGVLLPGAKAVSTPACVRAVRRQGNMVTATGGDARTLYVGAGPTRFKVSGEVDGVVACTTPGGGAGFHAPHFKYSGSHGPFVEYVAVIGTHVLVFTRRF